MTYIAPQAKVLRHLDRIVGWQSGATPAPVTVEWDLSNRCFLGCQDCHFSHTHVRGPWATKDRRLPMAFEGTGDLADEALVTRVLGELAEAGVQSVIWSGGGDPTTHPNWPFLVTLAATHGLQQGMYTAGGLLTRETAGVLARACSWVVVSLDAPDAVTYAHEKRTATEMFKRACQGVRWLAESGVTVGVSFLLHSENWHRVGAMLTLARELGATYTTFRPTVQTHADQPAVCTEDREWVAVADPALRWLAREPDVEIDVERFRDYATWQGHGYTECHGIRLNTTITPDGRVWVCPQRRGVTALGDLRRESFSDLWARHPGQYTVDAGCRVMCRLHPINQTLTQLAQPMAHEAFL